MLGRPAPVKVAADGHGATGPSSPGPRSFPRNLAQNQAPTYSEKTSPKRDSLWTGSSGGSP
jgi:hypothetical protein